MTCSNIEVKVRRLSDRARLPEYATDGSGCFDLFADEHWVELSQDQPLVLNTGLEFEIPKGHVMLVFSRSGHGFKHDIRLSNCVGVIDSDYRGELLIKLNRDTRGCVALAAGLAVAQGIIIQYQQVKFIESTELSETERGQGGFGSTDKAP